MASKKNTTNLPPFRLISGIGKGFVIVETDPLGIEELPEGTTQAEAQKLCDLRNGIRPSAEPPSLHRRFVDNGVTPEDIDSFADDTGRNTEWESGASLPLSTPRAQKVIDNHRKWLPLLLREWAGEVATQCGFGGAKRAAWHTYLVFKAIRAEPYTFAFTRAEIDDLHYRVWPVPADPSVGDKEIETRTALAIFYLSADAVRIKAAYVGASERTYHRQIIAAHRWLAHHWVHGSYPGAQVASRAPRVGYLPDDDDGQDEDDGGPFHINADDLAGFSR